MARVTEAQVRAILDVDTSIADLTEFIETANMLVTDVLAGAGYSTAKMERIELWLAAHFVAIRDPLFASEGAGGVSASYQQKVDLNMAVTTYGQQAMVLDTGGYLAALNQKTTRGGRGQASVNYLGKLKTDDSVLI